MCNPVVPEWFRRPANHEQGGHRSLNGVRKYKRASNDQLRDMSSLLEPPCPKKVKTKENSSLYV